MSISQPRGLSVTFGLAAAALLSVAGGPGTTAASAPSVQDNDPVLSGFEGRAVAAEARSAGVTVTGPAPAASPTVRARDLPTDASASDDLPHTAMNAYRQAALVLASVRPTCRLDWSVLAAVGQIASDHGRAAGATLRPDGTSSRPIRGVAVGRDTDAGQLDGKKTVDRAVGPMRFLPSTWLATRVDGDGDGVRSPDDLDDASLAAAVHLCAGGADVSTPRGVHAALFSFSRSEAYVGAAVVLARAYRDGDHDLAGNHLGLGRGPWSAPASFAGATTTPDPHSTSSTRPSSREGRPSHRSASDATIPSDRSTPSSPPRRSPARSQDQPQPPRPDPNTRPSPVPGPRSDLAPAPDAVLAPDPVPAPDPAPAPGSSPTHTSGAGPLATSTAILTSCEVTDYCLGGQPLELGALDGSSGHDHDGDGSVETRREELDGLLGSSVTLQTETGTDGAVVRQVNGGTW